MSRVCVRAGRFHVCTVAILAVFVLLCARLYHLQVVAAAELAADTYNSTRGNMQEVRSKVVRFLEERGARLNGEISVESDQTGRAVKIVVPVRKIVNTFFFQHVGYLSSYTEARAVGKHDIL